MGEIHKPIVIDLFAGYPQWIFASFLIHGLQGAVAGYFFQKSNIAFYVFRITKLNLLRGFIKQFLFTCN